MMKNKEYYIVKELGYEVNWKHYYDNHFERIEPDEQHKDWIPTLDEAKEFALNKSKQTSFEYVDEDGNGKEVAINTRNFKIYREKNCKIDGERKMIEKTIVSRLIKSTGKFVNEELDEAA